MGHEKSRNILKLPSTRGCLDFPSHSFSLCLSPSTFEPPWENGSTPHPSTEASAWMMIKKWIGSKYMIKGMYMRLRQNCSQKYTRDLFTKFSWQWSKIDYHDFDGFYKKTYNLCTKRKQNEWKGGLWSFRWKWVKRGAGTMTTIVPYNTQMRVQCSRVTSSSLQRPKWEVA